MNKTKRTKAEQQELLAYLREKYEYMPNTGQLRHKGHEKPRKPQKKPQSNYLQLTVRWKGNVIHIAIHRAVWAVCKGYWPKQIDHINGDPTDNHIENLRECSQSENQLNMELPWRANPSSGLPGVNKNEAMWRTKIRGKSYKFSSPYQAFWMGCLCGKRYRVEGV